MNKLIIILALFCVGGICTPETPKGVNGPSQPIEQLN